MHIVTNATKTSPHTGPPLHAWQAPPPARRNSPMEAATSSKKNSLLDALPEVTWERWQPLLELVELPLGEALSKSGNAMSHVYFPTTAIVSLHYVTEDGASAEFAVVGNEGIVGIPSFLGGKSMLSLAVVSSAGEGLRLSASTLLSDFNQCGATTQLLLRYTQALITQVAQIAVCNRHHALDQQLCRLLLLNLDRQQGNEIVMTQELISNMLGVRREGVTEAAIKLQRLGLIRYARGHITVLDRIGIEERACECYAVVKREYARLLPTTLAVPRMPGLPLAQSPSNRIAIDFTARVVGHATA